MADPVTRAVELFEGRGGAKEPAVPDVSGAVRSVVLDVTSCRIDGPKLRITWATGLAEL